MRFIYRFIFYYISNLISLIAAAYFIKGFMIRGDFKNFLAVAALFTAINILIRPILKLIFSPIIILTLGLGILFVNALMLYLLAFLSKNVIINGIIPLIYATLFVSIANMVIHSTAKRLYENS